MSLFSKSAYIWLASVMRDIRYKGYRIDRKTKTTINNCINDLAKALEDESPEFDKPRFYHNIYCFTDHSTDLCKWGYDPHKTRNKTRNT